ncbi:glucose dehydrogenase [Sphingomonas panacisoli]|uniref:Glucose dehydrogenase n=1 Tax=Sphingomonas panacisoli TaxID=1813879 RepID=A0A5B8LLH9_9SPHN|nr:PQQ-dependent sugar dehydrogenase [Sphingomonas panacisoli]QDZ08809.1 glucose dehydrogenase [Sphingomonas panacisoli]
MRLLLGLFALFAFAQPAVARKAPREGYATSGQCDGFPRVSLTTPARLCVGLVATGIGFPRGLAVVGTDLYVADLASRTPGRGRILRFANFGRGAPVVVLSGLNQPNGLAAGASGKLYVGEVGRIIRFDPRAADPRATITEVMTGLPKDGRHDVTAFTLSPDGGMVVNVGSFSDNCESENGGAPNPNTPCPEQKMRPPRGSLIRIPPGAALPMSAASAEVLATGLRNAMAFAYLPDGKLMVASNGRDNIDSADPKLSDDTLPHDLLLAMDKGANYGWPYCFDANRPSPEYPRYDCGRMRRPAMLLAPHAAPLGMIRYTGTKLPGLTGKLLLAYHGYRARGHRIVAIAAGLGGAVAGSETDIVSGWTRAAGVRPQGFPAALIELPDGSVLIAEDQNRCLLRLSAL